MIIKHQKGFQESFKSPEPTAVGACSSAVAVHALWPRVPELWTLGVIMTDSQIDDAVLSSIEPRWQKVAMVIGRAAKILYGDLPDGDDAYEMIARRIEFLVEEGRLQSQGDISRWRF